MRTEQVLWKIMKRGLGIGVSACLHLLQRKMPPVLPTNLRHPLLPFHISLSLATTALPSRLCYCQLFKINLFPLARSLFTLSGQLNHLKLFRQDASLVLFRTTALLLFSSLTLISLGFLLLFLQPPPPRHTASSRSEPHIMYALRDFLKQ